MSKINIKTSTGCYDIFVEKNALDRLKTLVDTRCVIVIDKKVYALWHEYLDSTLDRLGIDYHITLVDGDEVNKNIDNVLYMYREFNKYGITKCDYIVCIGGGVVGDMTAFAAATYLRGVEMIQVPTTLLSMVDSSIGGKSAIDMEFGKNLVGVIKAPHAVLIDSKFLDTLDRRQFATGMAEIVKSGLIGDSRILDEVEKSDACIDRLIELSLGVKGGVVMRDEFETGERMVLNFGHTIGHAIEALGEYREYTHGEAVSIGMYSALKLSERLLDMDSAITDRILSLYAKYDMPHVNKYDVDSIMRYVVNDKKMRGGTINFVLIESVGKPNIMRLDIDALRTELERLK